MGVEPPIQCLRAAELQPLMFSHCHMMDLIPAPHMKLPVLSNIACGIFNTAAFKQLTINGDGNDWRQRVASGGQSGW